ncbi:MAG: SDR family oxidoreductase [Thermodesulfobacteriota bacterium]
MNRAALITGGAKRIGKALAVNLAKKGFDIAIHYNSSSKEAEETKTEIKNFGVNCNTFKCDLENTQDVLNLVSDVKKNFPNIYILINNASIFDNISFLDVTPEFFDRDFNINLKAPFFLSQGFAKNVDEGLIVNFLDTRINRTAIDHFVYNLSKKCLYHLTRMLAKELAPAIRVNGICPGPILPPPGENEDYLAKLKEKVPMKKIGNTGYIVNAFNYLLENDFTTGECLFVDGGKHLNY